MSYYEYVADTKNYFFFEKQSAPIVYAHFHSAVEFAFVVEGIQEVLVGGERRILHAGDAFFADGFCVHSHLASKNAKVVALVGDRGYFEPIFQRFDGRLPPKFFRFEDFALLDFLLGICSLNYQNREGRYATNEGCAQIIVGAVAENVPFVNTQQTRHELFICDLLKYAEEHLSEDLSLGALAKIFGYSHEHLSRILHKYLLENWSVYLARLRVRKADRLLKSDPSLSVLDAALQCGFNSTNTFYRAYKKEFGVPPKRIKNINF
ncbi:MAG: helix-turn-helix domain-containing protein [Clostridiales bacterium]|nr:helix-turn-helix domain-containing protein [Clostridiales bacterium]MBQ2768474.1 AraC family transcriptional regulator [Clostridia bacterium]